MNWLRDLLHLPRKPDPLMDRADRLADMIEKADVVVTVRPKNARALAELRRLEGNARR